MNDGFRLAQIDGPMSNIFIEDVMINISIEASVWERRTRMTMHHVITIVYLLRTDAHLLRRFCRSDQLIRLLSTIHMNNRLTTAHTHTCDP